MTVYTDIELSTHDGSPVEAFKFTGSFDNYYYTSAETNVTINGQEYISALISRKAVNTGTQEDSDLDLELELPMDLALVIDYAFQVSPPDLTVEILRYHEGTNPASDWVIIWKGVVTSFSSSGHKVRLLVPSIFSITLSGEVPSIYYQNMCNHVLYDAQCKLVKASYQQDTTITVVDSGTITVAADGFADSVLKAGEIINTTKNERRLIIDNISDVLTINFPFFNAEVGDNVSLFAGCDHAFTTCRDTFSNTLNYGGFPYVPSDNPFENEL